MPVTIIRIEEIVLKTFSFEICINYARELTVLFEKINLEKSM